MFYLFQYTFTSIIIPTTEFSFPVLESSFFFILSLISTFTSRTEQVVLTIILLFLFLSSYTHRSHFDYSDKACSFFCFKITLFPLFLFRFHFDFRYNFSRWICSFNYCILNDVYPFSFIFHLYSWNRVYSFIEFIATVFPCSVFRKQFHFDYNYWKPIFPLNYCVHFVFSLLVLILHLDSSQLVFSFVDFNLTVFHSFLFRFRFHFDYDFPRLVYPFNYHSRRYLYHFIFRLHFDSWNWVRAFIDLNATVFPSFLLDIFSNCSGSARGQVCFYNNKKQMTNAMR